MKPKTKLPEGWQEVELGNKEFFDIQPSGIDKFEGEKDYLSTESIQGTDIEKVECKITYKDRPSRANMQPVLNSVWFAKMQATLKVYSFTQANKGEINGFILSTGFAGIRVEDSKVDPFYLRHFLKSKEFNKIKDSNCSGATQKAIGNEKLAKIKIPLPSLSVQKKIVKLLDRAEQAKIKREKADELTKDYLQSVFYDLFGDNSKKSKKFEVKELKFVCDKITDGTHNSPPNSEEGDFAYITAKNIKKEGIDLSNLTYIDKKSHAEIYKRCNSEMGDVLYIKDGATTGIAVVNNLKFEFSLLSSVALIKPNRKILNGHYLTHLLNSPSLYKKIRGDMGGAAITRLTLTKIEKIKIPIPPIELQQKFAKIVEQVEKLKEKQQKSKEKIEQIFNSLMQKAFRGELVK